MRARLFCKTGELAGMSQQLTHDNVIGRNRANDLVLQSKLISARHARIYAEKGAFFLEDLGSSNGTWLDGIRVQEPVRLDRLNVITLAGRFDFVFQLDEAAAAEKPEEAAPASPSGTLVDLEAFAPLPELEQPGAAKPVDQQAAGPSTERSRPPTSDDVGTRVDRAAFEPLPELAAERPQRYGLEVTFPDGRHQTFDLAAGRHTLGRASDCDITLNERTVSRHHATLIVGDTVKVDDAESSNAIYVEGRRVREAEIRPGSTFTLGRSIEVKLVRR